MRAGTEHLLASVVQVFVFGSAQVHHGYLFANTRTTRIKLLVHDGFGVWCAARRLNAGRFIWPREGSAQFGSSHADRWHQPHGPTRCGRRCEVAGFQPA